MPALPRELRQVLDRTVVGARRIAESAAKSALSTLAVDREKPFDDLSESDRKLRRALRAKERQLGSYDALVSETAYQHWHRMLFARFLAENHLLIHPEHGIPVSLAEVADLAREGDEPDPWVLAARYAANMLPAIFREGDPELAIRFAPEGRKRLEDLLTSLPTAVFTSDDGLGWVYQFWQSEKKKEVNSSGSKIGAAELPAVTQLFTENYMVRFLLENSLGAWWAGRHPNSPLLERFTYLRFTEEGKPAAGTFEGWPQTVTEVTVMDPCCGSGHFLTVAFQMLTAMRMEDEGLSAAEAGDAVIEQNLFGLEIDPRCTQLAAFSLALGAWRSGGYRELPPPNIACSGIGVAGQLADWRKLATGDEGLENALTALHEQFRNAPELGSLIDPRRATEEGHLFSVEYEKVAPLLEELLSREPDPETQVAGWAAAGIAHAAWLLARTYTLVVTNPPFLGRGDYSNTMASFVDECFPEGREDLATSFLLRCTTFSALSGTVSMVTPQNWLFLHRFEALRALVLSTLECRVVAQLGEGAFVSSGAAGAMTALIEVVVTAPASDSNFVVLDLTRARDPIEKDLAVRTSEFSVRKQRAIVEAPGRVITTTPTELPQLGEVVASWQGLVTSDVGRFIVKFWEVPAQGTTWERFLTAPAYTHPYSGRDSYLRWEAAQGALHRSSNAHNFNPVSALGRSGVLIASMRVLRAAVFTGEMFNDKSVPLIPYREQDIRALWAYCTSSQFTDDVRALNQQVNVGSGYFLKVPFDLEHWTKVAEELYPDGLPEPSSNDPTQWLFKGDPTDATEALQVAVARLLGYRWPDQEPDALDELVDADGVVPIPAMTGEVPAAERLRALLERAWGEAWSPSNLIGLLTQAGAGGKDLETWLRDSFFSSHAKLFHNRPFIWHIWDGRKDGFGVLVNYHRLDRQLLDRITHTLLGSWIEAQRDQVRKALPGAEARLVAAQDLQRRLELIAEGERPYDIYVRWKPLAEQPIGWDPDLNDGVRLNIRPFVKAGVLRSRFTINWNKAGGRDPDGSERLNDLHYTRAEKQAAREKVEG
jgi:hypothetical protein